MMKGRSHRDYNLLLDSERIDMSGVDKHLIMCHTPLSSNLTANERLLIVVWLQRHRIISLEVREVNTSS